MFQKYLQNYPLQKFRLKKITSSPTDFLKSNPMENFFEIKTAKFEFLAELFTCSYPFITQIHFEH